ncbi:uncharacterized protein JCM6883_001461 [Sporobolomyces salmoneus]|uniref:uncharacterized protein n=1 Tax=Sporobolomyces salmoneus TaxID=183962 RepID=UPI003170AE02
MSALSRSIPSDLFELSVFNCVAGTLLASLVYFVWHYRDGRAIGTRRRPDLYSPRGQQHFLLGDVINLVKNQDRAMERFMEARTAERPVSEKGKALSFTAPYGRRLIEISSPEMLEYVQKTNFSNFVKGPLFYKNLSGLLGDGIFVVDGKEWQAQRKATSKIFTANNFKGVISQSIDSNLNKLMTIIGRHADAGTTFDLSELFFRFTLASFSEMAFGSSFGALSTETDEPVPFAKAFDYGQVVMNRRFTNPFWHVTEFFDGTKKKMDAANKVMDDFAFGVIKQREEMGRGNFVGSQKKEAADKDLLSLYMALRDENGQPMNRKALRDALMNLIIAGRDTTAQALSWTFFRLILHPELIKPLREEIDQLGHIDYDSYKSLVQTLAAFNEGLRLHPSVPKNAWQAVGDDQIPNGPRIEAGDQVYWSDWVLGRDTSIWGPDAAEYKPSRWIDEKGELKKESQFKAHYFNGGYRHCLGMNLALYEGVSVLAAIIRDYDLSFAPNYLENTEMVDIEFTPRYLGALTLSMAAPFQVRAVRRSRN